MGSPCAGQGRRATQRSFGGSSAWRRARLESFARAQLEGAGVWSQFRCLRRSPSNDDATWPSELRTLFETELAALRAFEREEWRILELKYKKGWETRWPPPNPYQAVHDSVIARATELAANLLVVGYHCTRLHGDEIDSILSAGMVALTRGHFEQRVRARVTRAIYLPSWDSSYSRRTTSMTRTPDTG